jgi:hypothetical protein
MERLRLARRAWKSFSLQHIQWVPSDMGAPSPSDLFGPLDKRGVSIQQKKARGDHGLARKAPET